MPDTRPLLKAVVPMVAPTIDVKPRRTMPPGWQVIERLMREKRYRIDVWFNGNLPGTGFTASLMEQRGGQQFFVRDGDGWWTGTGPTPVDALQDLARRAAKEKV